VHFSPFAVMNAVDPGFPAQVLQGDRHRRTLQHLGELAEPLADEFPP
jgi:hypothetical protein